jgi:hypothetical protein
MGKVLVLGAYGLAGREIVRGLIEKTELAVVASGRNEAKLAALASRLDASRLQTRVLDAYDPKALTQAVEEADLVINAVGPYAERGPQIAMRVMQAGRPYVDFANEQSHYRQIQALDATAREKGVPLVTGAGAIPGVSTLLAGLAAQRIPDLHSVEMFYAQGRMPEAEGGLASMLSAVLESGLGSVTLRDGKHVRLRLGDEQRKEALPDPFGSTPMVRFPTLDALVVPQKVPLRSLATYWAMGEVPPGFFALLRLLKPHERTWAYKLVRRITEWSMKQDYERAVKKGLGPEGILKIVGRGTTQRWESLLSFPDGGIATAFLPVLTARRFFEAGLGKTGLLTVLDLFDPEDALRAMQNGGWATGFEESFRH